MAAKTKGKKSGRKTGRSMRSAGRRTASRGPRASRRSGRSTRRTGQKAGAEKLARSMEGRAQEEGVGGLEIDHGTAQERDENLNQ